MSSQGTQGSTPWACRVGHAVCSFRRSCLVTRLSSGDRGQIVQATTLLSGPRPTFARFLTADHSNLWAQTSSGSCTKRLRGVVPDSNLAEGRELGTSAQLRHARRKAGVAPLRGRCGDPGLKPPKGPCAPPWAEAPGFPRLKGTPS